MVNFTVKVAFSSSYFMIMMRPRFRSIINCSETSFLSKTETCKCWYMDTEKKILVILHTVQVKLIKFFSQLMLFLIKGLFALFGGFNTKNFGYSKISILYFAAFLFIKRLGQNFYRHAACKTSSIHIDYN